jgi:PucR family transcriptional regulator, purine catabolism regulatory protein
VSRSAIVRLVQSRRMAVTIRDILSVSGLALRLLAGERRAGEPLRWVHVSELEDPTPWLRGGELVLTTGMGVGATPAKQRAYVRRLADAGVGGIGFGLGFSHDRVPKAAVAAAEASGLPLLEVPYPVPFIAITEAVFTRLAAEQFEQLQRAFDAEHVLTRAVLDGGGVAAVARALADVTRGWVLLLDLHGMTLATTSRAAEGRRRRVWDEIRSSRPDGGGFSLSLVDRGHHVWIQPVASRGRVEAFLAVGKPDAPTPTDRIVATHALSLVALELAKSRAVAEAERRLQGDFFHELAGGLLAGAEAKRGLARYGFPRDEALRAISIEGDGELADAVADVLSRGVGAFLISSNDRGVSILVSVPGEMDVERLVEAVSARLGWPVRAGAGDAVSPDAVARAVREAEYALRVCRLEGWTSARFTDLGTYRLLLSMTEPDALRAFADSLLAPIDAYDRTHGGDLGSSLRAFLDHNARWESAASELSVHRHTLRYRMRKVEELTRRDLSSSLDRVEFWLALRARELLDADSPP